MSAVPPDEPLVPLSDDELEALAVKVAVARETPPGSGPPDPRPRKDVLAEAQEELSRLLGEVRRQRARARRWREHLKTARGRNDPQALARAVDDLLDDLM